MHHKGLFDLVFIMIFLSFALIRVPRDVSNKRAQHVESRSCC